MSQELCVFLRVYIAKIYWQIFSDWIYGHIAFKCPNYTLAISEMLERWAREHGRRSAAVLRVPIMVEATEHCLVPKIAPKGRVNAIAFSGDLGHTGEVEGLLRSFRRVIDKIPDALLIIAGSANQRGRCDDLQAYANELDLVENVKFLGQLTRDKLPAFYASATALALPREKEKFSDAGLPTKLAEYVLSGAAVLTTAVGDIPLIKNGWNGYLVPPGYDEAFAEKILYILSHQE